MLYELSIYLNRCWTWAACGICGDEIDVLPGPQLYRQDDDEPVCLDCAAFHAPELVQLLYAGERLFSEE